MPRKSSCDTFESVYLTCDNIFCVVMEKELRPPSLPKTVDVEYRPAEVMQPKVEAIEARQR